jgi:hypothetical protein
MNTKYNAYYEEQMRLAEARCGHKLVFYDEKIDKLLVDKEITDAEQRDRLAD